MDVWRQHRISFWRLQVPLWRYPPAKRMNKVSSVEIRFDEAEMIVSPSLKGINRQELARQMWAEVAATLNQSRPSLLTDLVVDLGKVTWISSVGLNELIRLQTLTRSVGISLRLRSVSETVQDVFRLTRLERIFQLEDHSGEALAGAALDSAANLGERPDSVATP